MRITLTQPGALRNADRDRAEKRVLLQCRNRLVLLAGKHYSASWFRSATSVPLGKSHGSRQGVR